MGVVEGDTRSLDTEAYADQLNLMGHFEGSYSVAVRFSWGCNISVEVDRGSSIIFVLLKAR